MVFECPRCHERFDSSALDGLDARFPCCKYQIRVANLIPLFQALCRCVDEQAHALKQIDPGSILEELPPVDKRPVYIAVSRKYLQRKQSRSLRLFWYKRFLYVILFTKEM